MYLSKIHFNNICLEDSDQAVLFLAYLGLKSEKNSNITANLSQNVEKYLNLYRNQTFKIINSYQLRLLVKSSCEKHPNYEGQ